MPQPLLQAISYYLECFEPTCKPQQLKVHKSHRDYYRIIRNADLAYYHESNNPSENAEPFKEPRLPIEILERLFQERLPQGHNAHTELVRQAFLLTIEEKFSKPKNSASAPTVSIPTVSIAAVFMPADIFI